MNLRGIWAIYTFEMARTKRTIGQSIASPVISTILYFIVFGAAIGSRMNDIDGVEYGAFIVPGLIMLTVLSQSIANASFGIYFPRFTGTIYEVLSAPLSFAEVAIGYVGAAATKSLMIATIVLITAGFFVPLLSFSQKSVNPWKEFPISVVGVQNNTNPVPFGKKMNMLSGRNRP